MIMQPAETKQILDFIAAADGRNVTEQTYGAWHLVIGHLAFEQTRQAALMALQDTEIRWVEPKHILAKVAKLIQIQEADQRRIAALNATPEPKGAPMPVCKHGIGLLKCEPCCHQAAIDANLIPNRPMRNKVLINR
jgi:hypothetical protein